MTQVKNQKKGKKPVNTFKLARCQRGLRQEDLARAADVCLSCVTRSERAGEPAPSREGDRIAAILGLPPTPRKKRPVLMPWKKNKALTFND